jgi:methylmalonyl-CoA/ethylmalonyl-CoA epimerase
LISGLDHVAIAVKSLEEAVPFFRDQLGLEYGGIEEVPEQKVRVACFKLGGARIELLEPTAADSPISKFLAERGGGLHHVALRTETLSSELERLEGLGVRLIDKQPRDGADGMKIAFLHPKSTQGVLMELTQPPPK